MYYKSINELISDEEILEIARENLKNNTIPVYSSGKSELQRRVLTGMMYLTNKNKYMQRKYKIE